MALTSLLGGCGCLVIAGDGAFRVTGEVLGNAENCEIDLLSDTGAPLPYMRKAIVKPTFSETFVVSPCTSTYQVVVSCHGVLKKAATIRYGSDVKPGEEVSLGKIAL
jgi:hypothetical protein